jgi:hypothetical protein
MRRKETGHWGGVRGRHERTPTRLGSGSGSGLGRAGTGFASRYEDGDGLAGLHCFGWAAWEWEMAVGSGSASGRVSAHSQC